MPFALGAWSLSYWTIGKPPLSLLKRRLHLHDLFMTQSSSKDAVFKYHPVGVRAVTQEFGRGGGRYKHVVHNTIIRQGKGK